MNFIKKNWDWIKDDFMKLMHAFYEDGVVIEDLNYTFITLIPKTKCPVNLKEYRRISLIGSSYKVLAKVLANRLKIIMKLVIGQSQMAFIKGGQIVDSFVADEVIHQLKKHGKGGLLFVDDMISFLEPNMEYLLNVKRILRCFELVSGLRVNFHKSCLVRVGKKRPLFPIPIVVAKKLEKLQRAFFWNDSHMRRKIHSIDRDTLSKHKKHGGLGIGK
ncbi:hypothetical protein Ddye_009897 [Dipteronia dyeriana]|uniref:Reverse transcriptase domain-containing protein n=1 Tax=Dipteronia dyeriana TaxID=168575 RepID=A0AAE0CMM6_9ROSI|nr:hypothetical protein Ddye_009897 [Dipteronia dyeriana]